MSSLGWIMTWMRCGHQGKAGRDKEDWPLCPRTLFSRQSCQLCLQTTPSIVSLHLPGPATVPLVWGTAITGLLLLSLPIIPFYLNIAARGLTFKPKLAMSLHSSGCNSGFHSPKFLQGPTWSGPCHLTAQQPHPLLPSLTPLQPQLASLQMPSTWQLQGLCTCCTICLVHPSSQSSISTSLGRGSGFPSQQGLAQHSLSPLPTLSP